MPSEPTFNVIYLLTAIGLTPDGSSTVHIYTQTIRRTTQSTPTIHRTTQSTPTIYRTTQSTPTIYRTTMITKHYVIVCRIWNFRSNYIIFKHRKKYEEQRLTFQHVGYLLRFEEHIQCV
jgi:hypothetical protein